MAEKIDTLLKEGRVYQPTAQIKAAAYIQDYDSAYKKSIADPGRLLERRRQGAGVVLPWTKVLEWNYPWAKWFVGATCNITYNCLDRHVRTWRRNKVAVIWIGENDQEQVITYGELYRQVNRCANALKKLGLTKGDRVTIYLPKVPEQIVAMLACARIGAIHSVVYSGFSAPALANRIQDAESKLVITADVGFDRGKVLNLKSVVDQAVANSPTVERVVVLRRQTPGVNIIRPEGNRLARLAEGREGGLRSRASGSQNIRCTSSIRPAPPENLKAWSMSTAATWSGPTSPRNTSSISKRRCLLLCRRPGLGHRPQLYCVWSPCSTAPRSSQLKASRTIRTRAAGGI